MMFTESDGDDVAETMGTHELVALSSFGARCACGSTSDSWLEHLADVAMSELGTQRPTTLRLVPEPEDETLTGSPAAAALAQAAHVLAELQRWQDVVAEASALHHDITTDPWPTIAAWHASVPPYLAPASAERWLRSQRVQASWRRTPTPISPARQLELALGDQPAPRSA
jgi:hypothetical protein